METALESLNALTAAAHQFLNQDLTMPVWVFLIPWALLMVMVIQNFRHNCTTKVDEENEKYRLRKLGK